MTNEKVNELDIENRLIEKFKALHYTYRTDITNAEEREKNFRNKFEELNQVKLSDKEFSRLLTQIISSDVFTCGKHLRETNTLIRDDETPLNYKLIDERNWCKNSYEVVRQQHSRTVDSYHRYDVLLLINGLPLVQIELKTFGISPRKAIQQIISYKNDTGNGYSKTLLCFIQFFVVSNGTKTMYFANNNNKHFKFDAEERFLSIYRFADEKNDKITNLYEFADAVLAKSSLGDIITRYMVLVETEQQILMMRPYQIYAVKNIMTSVNDSRGNGYIWHTTGSGKTLTSFKASILLKENPNIDKCLFVVDRKDLDTQTRNEFNKFQSNCVEENATTAKLVERMLSTDYKDKVIVTTIQKLGIALDECESTEKNKNGNRIDYSELKKLSDKRIVFIFDECHRSQFGENHKAIKRFFPNSKLYGFTGTPIFDVNAVTTRIEDSKGIKTTTLDVFENLLHQYTITDAIDDDNVLKFHVDYYSTDTDLTPTKKQIVDYILDKHNQATNGRMFNALFATTSINDAIEYYNLFKASQAERIRDNPSYSLLNITSVFSPPAENSIISQIQEDLPEEKESYINSTPKEKNEKKQSLENIITDYNTCYGTNHSINDFYRYYQDVQERIKNQQYPNSDALPQSKKIDIVIVVDMLLTGFDSKYLNTLYVDKNLKYHSLIQAFSRTNRVLNATKPFGNILDFRNQKNNVDEAIHRFSGKNISGDEARKVWIAEDPDTILSKYKDNIKSFENFMNSKGLQFTASDVLNLHGDDDRGEFISRFKEIQRLKTRLEQYTDLSTEQEHEFNTIIPSEEFRSFRSMYLEIANKLRNQEKSKLRDKEESKVSGEESNEPDKYIETPDCELVLFASVIVDYDYIMRLVLDYTGSDTPTKTTKEAILNLISSDAKFMDSKEDLAEYIDTLSIGDIKTEEELKQGFEKFKNSKIKKQINELANKFGVDKSQLETFVTNSSTRLRLDSDELTALFEPQGLGWEEQGDKEYNLVHALKPIWHKLTNGQEIHGVAVYDE